MYISAIASDVWRPFSLSIFVSNLEIKTKTRLYLFGSLSSSRLCPTLIQFPSDWIFAADWVNVASHPQTVPLTQLFHSSSFLSFTGGVNHPPGYPSSLSHWLLWVPLLFASGFSLAAQIRGLVPKLFQPLTFPITPLRPLGCLPVLAFSFYSIVFSSLPPQGRSVCATAPECWTLRCWSVHLRSRFTQRWGDESCFLHWYTKYWEDSWPSQGL